jgi:hypothetical protein
MMRQGGQHLMDVAVHVHCGVVLVRAPAGSHAQQ